MRLNRPKRYQVPRSPLLCSLAFLNRKLLRSQLYAFGVQTTGSSNWFSKHSAKMNKLMVGVVVIVAIASVGKFQSGLGNG